MESSDLVEAWKATINSPDKSWVLFENGTCVVLVQPEEDLAAQAAALLREFGPVQPGTASGDFSVVEVDPGWVVTCHHPDILTLVGPDDADAAAADMVVGLLGRSRREQDAAELRVLHVEDRRCAG